MKWECCKCSNFFHSTKSFSLKSLLQKPLHRYCSVNFFGKCLILSCHSTSYIPSKGQCPLESIKSLTLGPDFRPEKKVRRKCAEIINFWLNSEFSKFTQAKYCENFTCWSALRFYFIKLIVTSTWIWNKWNMWLLCYQWNFYPLGVKQSGILLSFYVIAVALSHSNTSSLKIFFSFYNGVYAGKRCSSS